MNIHILRLTILLLLFFLSCKKNEPQEPQHDSILLYEKTELGGCNTRNDSVETKESDDDTINITVTKESVHLFVGLNYTCMFASFETRSETVDDVVYMYIIDSGDGYYRCYCYYTFDFIFKRESTTTLNQKYKVLLIDPRKEEHVIISEGVISDNK